ncbi:MAG: hypothetical protein D6690_15795 [Nitrospirae bacterium]|nr:MAG: hypothetical protein D6690_15795 [Nitrospirota bacterium]
MTSFRTRIRWATLGVFLLLLIIFCLSVYVGLSHILLRYIDESLLTLAQAEAIHIEDGASHIEEFLEAEANEVPHEKHERDERAYTRHELQEAVRESVIMAPDRTVLWRGDTVPSLRPLPDHLWARVIHGETVFDTVDPPQGPPLRRMSIPIIAHGQTRYILQSFTSLQFVEETQQRLMMTLGGLSGVIFLLVWAAST